MMAYGSLGAGAWKGGGGGMPGALESKGETSPGGGVAEAEIHGVGDVDGGDGEGLDPAGGAQGRADVPRWPARRWGSCAIVRRKASSRKQRRVGGDVDLDVTRGGAVGRAPRPPDAASATVAKNCGGSTVLMRLPLAWLSGSDAEVVLVGAIGGVVDRLVGGEGGVVEGGGGADQLRGGGEGHGCWPPG